MSRVYRLVIWGRELFAWEVDGALEITVTTDAEADAEDEEESEDITGAGSHNFERDLNPRYPEAEKDYDSWIDRPFGFTRGE